MSDIGEWWYRFWVVAGVVVIVGTLLAVVTGWHEPGCPR